MPNSPLHAFGRQNTGRSQVNKDDSCPGAQSYSPDKLKVLSQTPRASIGKSPRFVEDGTIFGKNFINLPHAYQENMMKKPKTDKMGVIGKDQRFKLQSELSPGPGEYNPDSLDQLSARAARTQNNKLNHTHHGSFMSRSFSKKGSSKRNVVEKVSGDTHLFGTHYNKMHYFPEIDKDFMNREGPGPAKYELFSKISHGPGIQHSFGKTSRKIELKGLQEEPGPNSYKHQKYAQRVLSQYPVATRVPIGRAERNFDIRNCKRKKQGQMGRLTHSNGAKGSSCERFNNYKSMWKQISNVLPQSVLDAAHSVRQRLGYSPTESTISHVPILSLTVHYLPLANLLTPPRTDQSLLTVREILQHTYRCALVATASYWELFLLENPFNKPQSVFRLEQGPEQGGVVESVNIDLARSLELKNEEELKRIASLMPLFAMRREAVSKECPDDQTTGVWLYSLKLAKYVSCVKNSAPVRSLRSNGKILAIQLADGSIKLYSLSEVASAHPRLLLLQVISSGEAELGTIAMSCQSYAYTQAVREEANLFSKLEKNLDKSAMASYPLTKEAARKLLKVGEMGYNTVSSLISINQATSESAHQLPPFQTLSPSNFDDQEGKVRNSPRLVHQLIVKKEAGVTLFRTRLPHFQLISSLHFSPSGTLLVVGNQKAQYFFVLRIYPDTETTGAKRGPPFSILYSLFRGYTPAKLNSLHFSLDERWLSLETDHGTAHIFHLQSHNPSSPSFLPRVNRGKQEAEKEDDRSLREISHLKAFGRVKLSSSKSNGVGCLVFLTSYKVGYEYASSVSRKQGEDSNLKTNSRVKLAMVLGDDGLVKTVELIVSGKEVNGHTRSKEQLLGHILRRNQIPSKSNYFLEALEIKELSVLPLMEDSLSTLRSKLQQQGFQAKEGENGELAEGTIERHLAKSRHSYTVIKNPNLRGRESEQMKRRKTIKMWVSCSEIKNAPVLYTPVQQSPLFEMCQYDLKAMKKKESELQLLRSPSKRKELDAVRATMIEEKRFSCDEKQDSVMNESLQVSHFSEQPRVLVYRRVKKERGEEQDPLGALASYSGVTQSMFQASLDEARDGKVAPMFEQDVSKQGVVLSQYEIQDQYAE